MAVEQISLNYTPREWQREVHALAAKHPMCVINAHRRSGKTYAACATLALAALARPDMKFAYFAPLRRQAKEVSWGIFQEILRDVPGMKWREADLIIEFPNKATITLYSGQDHMACRGLGFAGVVLDEVAQYGAEAWHGSIRPTLSGIENSFALFISTPSGLDLFESLYRYAETSNDPLWGCASYPAWPTNSTGVLGDEEIDQARREALSEATFRREFGADLTVSSDDVLIKLEDVRACQGRSLPHRNGDILRRYARVMGVDVGGTSGGDKTVLAIRQGPVLEQVIEMQPELHSQVAFRIAEMAQSRGFDAIAIDAGGGYAIAIQEALMSLGLPAVIPIQFGSRAVHPEKYTNRRSELWDSMRAWIEKPDTVIPGPDKLPRIAQDLTSVRFKLNTANKLLLEPKADVRARLGRSPDAADALALTFIPVAPGAHSTRGAPAHLGWSDRGADGSRYYSGHKPPGPRSPYTEYQVWDD